MICSGEHASHTMIEASEHPISQDIALMSSYLYYTPTYSRHRTLVVPFHCVQYRRDRFQKGLPKNEERVSGATNKM